MFLSSNGQAGFLYNLTLNIDFLHLGHAAGIIFSFKKKTHNKTISTYEKPETTCLWCTVLA